MRCTDLGEKKQNKNIVSGGTVTRVCIAGQGYRVSTAMQRDDASTAPEVGGMSSNENLYYAASRDGAAGAAALLAPTQQPPLSLVSKAPTRAVLSSVDGTSTTINASNLSQPSPLRKLNHTSPPPSTAEAEVGEAEARSDRKAAAKDTAADTLNSATDAKATTTLGHIGGYTSPAPMPTVTGRTGTHFDACGSCVFCASSWRSQLQRM